MVIKELEETVETAETSAFESEGAAAASHSGKARGAGTTPHRSEMSLSDLPENDSNDVSQHYAQVFQRISEVYGYLQEIDTRLQDQVGRLVDTMEAVNSRVESMSRGSINNINSVPFRAGPRNDSSASGPSVPTPPTGMAPLIGRPAEPYRKESRNGTASSCNTHSLGAGRTLDNMDLSSLQRRPSVASSVISGPSIHINYQARHTTPKGGCGLLVNSMERRPSQILNLHQVSGLMSQRRPSNASASLASYGQGPRRPSIGSEVPRSEVSVAVGQQSPRFPTIPASTAGDKSVADGSQQGDDDTADEEGAKTPPITKMESKADSLVSAETLASALQQSKPAGWTSFREDSFQNDGQPSECPSDNPMGASRTWASGQISFQESNSNPVGAQWSPCPPASSSMMPESSEKEAGQRVKTRISSNIRTLAMDDEKQPGESSRWCCSSSRFVFAPGDKLRLAWDALMVAATMTATILMPFSLMYFSPAGGGVEGLSAAPVSGVLNAVDVLWILDVIVNCRTGYASQGRIVRDPWLIFRQYAGGWLALDLVTAWPAVLVPQPALITMRMLKLLRYFRLVHRMHRMDTVRSVPLLVVRVSVMILLPTHMLACLWRATRADVGLIDTSSESFSLMCSGTDVESLPEACLPMWQQYLADAYWVLMTLTTVGYGEIPPDGPDGRVVAIITMVIAPFFNGAVVSLLTHVSTGLFNDAVNMQVSEAARFLRRRDVLPELQRRVEHCLRCRLRQETQLAVMPTLLAKLSPSMQRELTLELLSSTVLNFRLFKGASVAFIAEIAQAHTWIQCISGDLIVEEGQTEHELVFVVLGRLLMFTPMGTQAAQADGSPRGAPAGYGSGTPSKPQANGWVDENAGDESLMQEFAEQEICVGGWFGEASLFHMQHVRVYTIFARVDSELAALPASSYHEIVSRYPTVQRGHNAIERDIHAGKLSLKELAYKVPDFDVPMSSSKKGGRRRWRWRSVDRKVAAAPPFHKLGP